MSNFTHQVFIVSLVLSLILGCLAVLLLRGTRQQGWPLSFFVSAVVIHLAWLAWPMLPGAVQEPTRWAFAIWLGLLLVGTALFPPFALATVVARVRQPSSVRPIAAIYAGVCLTCGIVLCIGGASLRIREESVAISDLDPRLDGFRVANFGDVHVDRFISPSDLAKAVSAVASRDVDVLAVTGDLIDDGQLIEPTLDALDDPRIPAKVSVIGNHEKMGELGRVIGAYRNRKDRISLLVDSSTTVSHAGARAHFVGVDYAMASDGGHMLPAAEQERMMVRQAASAFPKASPGEPVIALSHHPEFFRAAASHGAQLTLSSHTHGGQVKAFGRPLVSAYDYMAGLYQAGGRHLDVSAGFGHWLPLRFGVPREVVIVTLRRAA